MMRIIPERKGKNDNQQKGNPYGNKEILQENFALDELKQIHLLGLFDD